MRTPRVPSVLLSAVVVLAACDKQPEPKSKTTVEREASSAAAQSSASKPAPRPDIIPSIPFKFPAPERVVAFGDVHGDFDATRKVLQIAQVVDDAGHWKAGKLVVVQTGDQLDRGDDERKILDYFETLRAEAEKAGGAFHVLLGNHETMNAMADFRYVTQGGFKAFEDVQESGVSESVIGRFPASAQGRARAFLPGGKYAALLAKRNTVVIVGDSLFVHGGVLPEHVDYGLGRLNEEVRDWLSGKRSSPPPIIAKDDAPVWSRDYSDPESGKADCKRLSEVLERLELKRMVVGHTVQSQGVTQACGGKVWRIDVGLAHHYGGPTQALEIRGDAVSVLK